MNAKLGDFSEICKLGSVKFSVAEGIFSLFGQFKLSSTLRSLKMTKQCGHSASEVIMALCMFKVLGETISSMFSAKFRNLLSVGKNCFYRMLTRSDMDWRRLLAVMTVRFLAILRKRGVRFGSGTSCFILDDTTLEKTTTKAEFVSRVYDHVFSKHVLGFKLQLLCVSDGVTTIPVDFSIHREKGRKGTYGLTAKERKNQEKKKRSATSPEAERASEVDGNKIDVAIKMIKRTWKSGVHPLYVLADSWYLSEKILRATIELGGGALHYLGLGKMNKTRYKVNGRMYNANTLVTNNERLHSHDCRKYHCRYIALNGEYADTGIPVRIFLIRYGHNKNWNIMITTDLRISFVKAFETYQIRWSIEVLIKDCRQHLGLGRCQSNDFDALVADTTITLMTYQVAALQLRFSEYETMGEIFSSMEGELLKLSLWNVILDCLTRILAKFAELCNWDMEDMMLRIASDNETSSEILFLVKALEEYRKSQMTDIQVAC